MSKDVELFTAGRMSCRTGTRFWEMRESISCSGAAAGHGAA